MQKKREYFAGANTRNGYASYFNEIIGDKYRKVYILKGSSGCGKSTFIKRVGERALRNGLRVEYIRCSADSNSYDGILIPEKGIAVVDGTAPHIMDSKYPSARDNIINLGEFWDDAKLKDRREELISLIDSKNLCYENIYRTLGAAGGIREIRNSIIKNVVLYEKLQAFVNRICRKLIKPTEKSDKKNVSQKVYIQTAFNQNGFDSLPTFSDVKNVHLIRDKYDITHLLLRLIKAYAERAGAEYIISYDPIDFTKPEAIYFPNEDLLFIEEQRYVSAEEKNNENKPINTARFIDKKGYAAVRQKDRMAHKLYTALLNTAKQYFVEASRLHDNIERIYIHAMDFAKLTDFTNKFIGKIFGE